MINHDNNIASYLNLPEYIIEMYDEFCHDIINYDVFVNIYESNNNIHTVSNNVSYIVTKVNEITCSSKKSITSKFMMFVFLYYYIDKVSDIINNKNNIKIKIFKEVINDKLIETKQVYLNYYTISHTDEPYFIII